MGRTKVLPWIDWMKALGMCLIVFGHTGGHTLILPITHPFNPKQLGVAFFVFVTGFTLAREKRTPLHAIVHRLLDIFVLGVLVAVVMSCFMWISKGDINESNYLPFLMGLNVFDNAFPANPTTWYIGCYLHLLLAWGLVLRRLRPTWGSLAVMAAMEIGFRTVIIYWGRDYTAYMLLTNWLTIFWVGQWLGGQEPSLSEQASLQRMRGTAVACSILLPVFMVLWTMLVTNVDITSKNPFGRVPADSALISAFLTSLSVTGLYVVYTLGIWGISSALPASRSIGFLARNTLFVFLVHMPLIYALSPLLYPYVPQGWVRAIMNQLLYFVLLAVLSSYVYPALRLGVFKRWLDDVFVVHDHAVARDPPIPGLHPVESRDS